MILGIGTDIVDANRIDKIYNKFNYKFVERLYGSNEINILNNRKKISINFLAKRFAAFFQVKQGTMFVKEKDLWEVT